MSSNFITHTVKNCPFEWKRKQLHRFVGRTVQKMCIINETDNNVIVVHVKQANNYSLLHSAKVEKAFAVNKYWLPVII